MLCRVSACFRPAHLIAVNSAMHVAHFLSTNAKGKKIFSHDHRPSFISLDMFAWSNTAPAYVLKINVASPYAGLLAIDRPIALPVKATAVARSPLFAQGGRRCTDQSQANESW